MDLMAALTECCVPRPLPFSLCVLGDVSQSFHHEILPPPRHKRHHEVAARFAGIPCFSIHCQSPPASASRRFYPFGFFNSKLPIEEGARGLRAAYR